MNATYRTVVPRSAETRWALYAGCYFFAAATAVALALHPFLSLLGRAIGVVGPLAAVVFAGPALLFGTVGWWGIVERSGWHSFLAAGVVGLLTAAATGVVWTVRFLVGWGVEMAVAIWILVAFVLAAAVVGGTLAGLPLMALRRHAA